MYISLANAASSTVIPALAVTFLPSILRLISFTLNYLFKHHLIYHIRRRCYSAGFSLQSLRVPTYRDEAILPIPSKYIDAVMVRQIFYFRRCESRHRDEAISTTLCNYPACHLHTTFIIHSINPANPYSYSLSILFYYSSSRP